MKLYKKEGNILQILSFPTENAEKGDYLLVEEPETGKKAGGTGGHMFWPHFCRNKCSG